MAKRKKNEKTTKVTRSKTAEIGDLLEKPEVIESLTPVIKRVISMEHYSGPYPPQLFEKVTEGHITKVLDNNESNEIRRYNFARTSRWFKLLYTFIGVGVFIFITLFFGQKDFNFYQQLIRMFIIFGGGLGAGGGYLVLRYLRKENR